MQENSSAEQVVPAARERFGKEQFYAKMEERIYRTANYISIYLYIIIVYGGALLTDYLLFTFMDWLLRVDVERYPVVALGFDYAKVGLALLFIIAAVVHGLISTWGQVKLDLALMRESESQ